MRGEHLFVGRGILLRCGIIPACAGSTDYVIGHPDGTWGSSPHARGALENQARVDVTHGDHPRMRGEHFHLQVEPQRQPGIIPACAGSTIDFLAARVSRVGSSPHARGALPRTWHQASASRDHPRMRGEHRRLPAIRHLRPGIIPACAGSTFGAAWRETVVTGSSPHARGARRHRAHRRRRGRDHPRMRGEHQ